MSRDFNLSAKTYSDVWITPQWVIDAIGISGLDPCGWLPDGKPFVRTAKNYFTEKENGLIQSWKDYESVFVNFPYSQSRDWLTKCYHEFKTNKVEIIVLCFVRSETRAWQENVKFATGVNLINKRISFLNHQGETRSNGNAASCLIAFGEKSFERIQKVDGIILKNYASNVPIKKPF